VSLCKSSTSNVSRSPRIMYLLPSCVIIPFSISVLRWCTTVALVSPNLFASSSLVSPPVAFIAFMSSINIRKQDLSRSRSPNSPRDVPNHWSSSFTETCLGLLTFTMVILLTNISKLPRRAAQFYLGEFFSPLGLRGEKKFSPEDQHGYQKEVEHLIPCKLALQALVLLLFSCILSVSFLLFQVILAFVFCRILLRIFVLRC